MQTSRLLEIWVGFFIALGLLALLFLALQVSNLAEFTPDQKSYKLTARFENIGALRVRAPVSIAGVTIGRVSHIGYDQQSYQAVVEMQIEPAYSRLPVDTSASILTSGLLGEQYVGLSPGGADEYLKDGDPLELTQSAFVLEQMISRFLFSKAEGEGAAKTGSAKESDGAGE
jgi:phospholipid/cholesterol/gamma-HCH transport system substrate-binding protein